MSIRKPGKVRFVSEEAINGAVSIMLYDARTLNAETDDDTLGMTVFSAIVHACRERGYTPIVIRKEKNEVRIPEVQKRSNMQVEVRRPRLRR